MKRVLLFFSAFIIATGFALLVYFSISPYHAALRIAFTTPNADQRDIAAANAAEFEKAHVLAIFGNTGAQYTLGRFLSSGELGFADKETAIVWLKKAANRNHGEAMLTLARFSFLGEGQEKNEVEGAEWIRKAAEGGSSEARGLLGILYLGGIGVAQDFEQAMVWLAQSDAPEAQALAAKLSSWDSAVANLPPEEKVAQRKSAFAEAETDIRASFLRMLEEKKRRAP